MIGLLGSLWNAPAASPPARTWRDWALIAALVATSLCEGLLRRDLAYPLLAVALTLALLPTLLWRRRMPLQMLFLAAGTSAAVALATHGYVQLNSSAFLLILVYCVYRWGSGRAQVGGAAVMASTVSLSAVLRSLAPSEVVGAILVVLLTMTLGLAMRYRSAARMRELDGARLNERERLARDLHDTVAHHVSAIAIQAQAGLATASANPAAATTALRVIEAEASRTLAEMRAMVRVLRVGDAAELAPAAGIDDVLGLARGSEPGRPGVAVTVTGNPGGLPQPVAAAVFRIAQESVTNALRHGRGASVVEVLVDAGPESIRVEVLNDGDAAAAASPGFGITGMTERAMLLGGRCNAGPRAGGGWSVTAELPRNGVRS